MIDLRPVILHYALMAGSQFPEDDTHDFIVSILSRPRQVRHPRGYLARSMHNRVASHARHKEGLVPQHEILNPNLLPEPRRYLHPDVLKRVKWLSDYGRNRHHSGADRVRAMRYRRVLREQLEGRGTVEEAGGE